MFNRSQVIKTNNAMRVYIVKCFPQNQYTQTIWTQIVTCICK